VDGQASPSTGQFSLLLPSFNDLIRPRQQRSRDGEPEYLRRLLIDDQLELHGPLDGQVREFRSLGGVASSKPAAMAASGRLT